LQMGIERRVIAAKARPVAVSPATPRRERGARHAVKGKSPFAGPCERREEPRPLTACRARYHGRGARRQLWVAVSRAATGRIRRLPADDARSQSPYPPGGEEQETIQTRSRSAVLRGPSATRLRSFPSALILGTSRDVARVTADANERPFALGRLGARQAPSPFFSPPNLFDAPALAEKQHTNQQNHQSRSRNSCSAKL
jgi:hypothetical protein